MTKAKKSLGQHWLRSQSALKSIIATAQLEPTDVVLEIGPGTGVLTKALLGAGVQVTAVEQDQELIPILEEKFAGQLSTGQLKIITDDITKFIPASVGLKKGEYKLVANIPYYLTGEIIRQFLTAPQNPSLMVVLIQREVAKRIVAADKKESLLSISVKAYGKPKYIKTVKKESFSPKPKVDSAILEIGAINKDFFEQNKVSEADFFKVVRAGFAHKRKKLIRNLETISNPEVISALFKNLQLSENTRAEDLDINQWGKLAFGIIPLNS